MDIPIEEAISRARTPPHAQHRAIKGCHSATRIKPRSIKSRCRPNTQHIHQDKHQKHPPHPEPQPTALTLLWYVAHNMNVSGDTPNAKIPFKKAMHGRRTPIQSLKGHVNNFYSHRHLPAHNQPYHRPSAQNIQSDQDAKQKRNSEHEASCAPALIMFGLPAQLLLALFHPATLPFSQLSCPILLSEKSALISVD